MPSSASATIIVPCYNEASRLPVEALLAYGKEHSNITFRFVDDGSRDDTRKVLEAMADQAGGRVQVHGLDRNRGKAEAVRQGMNAAFATGVDFVGFWDADLATPLTEIETFVNILKARTAAEAVIGSRVRMLGRPIDRDPLRHYFGRVFATGASLFLRLGVYDTQCGAKLFRNTSCVRTAFATPFLVNWIFDVEIIARLYAGRHESGRGVHEDLVIEHPLSAWQDVEGSKVGFSASLEAARDLVRLELAYGKRLRRALRASNPRSP